MLESLWNSGGVYLALVGIFAAGVICKLIVGMSLRRLLRAAGDMGKSTHPFMRLVRAKFEHACMVSETVENVGVFVDKFIFEYLIGNIRLHSYRRMEKAASLLCVVTGTAAAFLEYLNKGMSDEVLRLFAAGAGVGILAYIVHLLTDEEFRLRVIRNYMVDYLENVCLPRYERMYHKEMKAMKPPEIDVAGEEAKREEPLENAGMAEAEKNTDLDVVTEALIADNAAMDDISEEKSGSGRQGAESQEKMIRQILEEFLA